jgi:hypothetical protein
MRPTQVIKSCQADGKHGFAAFVRLHSGDFVILGKHPNQRLGIKGGSTPPSERPPPAKLGSVYSAPPGKTAPIISPAAMAAAARAAASKSGAKPSSGRAAILANLDIEALREDLTGLRLDLAAATSSLGSAHERMHRLQLALGEDLGNLATDLHKWSSVA